MNRSGSAPTAATSRSGPSPPAGPRSPRTAGDRRGWNIARAVLDGRTPVMYDLWANMERFDVAGYYPIVAGLGGGKSTLIGVIIGKTGAAGIPWTCVDPAGRLGRLARTAPLRAHARSLDLVNGHPGSLNTYRLVADPHPDDFTIHDLADLEDTDLAALGVTADDLGTVTLTDLDPESVDAAAGPVAPARHRAGAGRAAPVDGGLADPGAARVAGGPRRPGRARHHRTAAGGDPGRRPERPVRRPTETPRPGDRGVAAVDDGAPAGRVDHRGAAGLDPARTPAVVVVPGTGRA